MSWLKRHSPTLSALLFCGVVLATVGDYGITYDEAVYFRAGVSYGQWLKNPSWSAIDSHWSINHEHPPLLKVLGGLTHSLFHDALPVLSHLSAFRLASLIFVFLGAYFTFLFAAEFMSRSLAFLSAAFFLLLPRVFFHAQLGAMDYPLACLWLAVIYASWRGMEHTGWTWAASFFLGLALLTKANAFLLYIPVLGLWAVSFLGSRSGNPQKPIALSFPGHSYSRSSRHVHRALALDMAGPHFPNRRIRRFPLAPSPGFCLLPGAAGSPGSLALSLCPDFPDGPAGRPGPPGSGPFLYPFAARPGPGVPFVQLPGPPLIDRQPPGSQV
jgi:hypothetical protein